MQNLKDHQRPLWRITAGERRFILIIGDLLMTLVALIIALVLWAQKDFLLQFSLQFLKERPPFWFYLLPVVWIILMIELYDVRRAGRVPDTVIGVLMAVLLAAFFYFTVFFIAEPNTLPRRGVAGFIAASAVFTLLWRLLYIKVFTAPAFLRRVLIIGAGRAGTTLAGMIQGVWPPPFYLVGYVDDDKDKVGKEVEKLPVLCSAGQLLKTIKENQITDLVFSITGEMHPEMFKAILAAEEMGVEVTTMPKIYEELFGRVPIFLLQDDWILRSFVDKAHSSSTYEGVKRLIDLLSALIGCAALILLSPLICVGILVDDGLPLLFHQVRLGKSGKRFELLKFRTMRRDAEADGVARLATVHDERTTRFGRFLRASHLDELPQFVNVLRGDISMVGPRAERPELIDQLQKQIPFYRARLFIKPGVTGWAQINQRYASNVEETAIKLEHDLYYIMHRNIILDLSIILRTLWMVIRFKGV